MEDTTGPKLDMPVPDGGSGPPIGCAGKIDFLVVVSADGTMKNNQEQLIASFPAFIDTIEAELPAFDVHIMSAASHSLWAFDDCADCNDAMCNPQDGLPFCGVQPEFCDKGKIGASVTFPVGEGASNRRCNLYGGNRFIISGEPNMAEMFGCIAQVGISAGGVVAEGMVRALGKEWVDGPNKCNKGFLRDDALLVVVLIQDTDDAFSEGTVESWIEALRAAKHGNDDAFAVLALTTDVDDPNCEGVCIPDECIAFNPTRLRQLVNGIEHGFIGSICKPFAPFFEQTVGHIVELCENFVIPQ
ncbi:hypothetical protein SAMN02745121_08440 [Nannocystis exedens]|uniref:VWFA domain-containing protein n=1 Tax=Nannocystis exedens TaxID=54 RepID=A0A1I2I4I7_9BACT|nr:hypothetical protein [Nannocystis exedens]PCC74634.1 hypothetical protein NAEX_07731 [Nannocystis exedens]SFF37192.1 hypothetical protein SAMN02745121_08440 [Nannocystis exedens]